MTIPFPSFFYFFYFFLTHRLVACKGAGFEGLCFAGTVFAACILRSGQCQAWSDQWQCTFYPDPGQARRDNTGNTGEKLCPVWRGGLCGGGRERGRPSTTLPCVWSWPWRATITNNDWQAACNTTGNFFLVDHLRTELKSTHVKKSTTWNCFL